MGLSVCVYVCVCREREREREREKYRKRKSVAEDVFSVGPDSSETERENKLTRVNQGRWGGGIDNWG